MGPTDFAFSRNSASLPVSFSLICCKEQFRCWPTTSLPTAINFTSGFQNIPSRAINQSWWRKPHPLTVARTDYMPGSNCFKITDNLSSFNWAEAEVLLWSFLLRKLGLFWSGREPHSTYSSTFLGPYETSREGLNIHVRLDTSDS